MPPDEPSFDQEWADEAPERIAAALKALTGEAKTALRKALEEGVTDPHARGQVFAVLSRLGL